MSPRSSGCMVLIIAFRVVYQWRQTRARQLTTPCSRGCASPPPFLYAAEHRRCTNQHCFDRAVGHQPALQRAPVGARTGLAGRRPLQRVQNLKEQRVVALVIARTVEERLLPVLARRAGLRQGRPRIPGSADDRTAIGQQSDVDKERDGEQPGSALARSRNRGSRSFPRAGASRPARSNTRHVPSPRARAATWNSWSCTTCSSSIADAEARPRAPRTSAGLSC